MSNVLKFLGGSVVALLLFGGWQLLSQPKDSPQRTSATAQTTRSGGAWFPTSTGTATTTAAPRTTTTTRPTTTTTTSAPTSYQESYRSTDWQQKTGYLRWYRGSFATKARCAEHRKLLFETSTSGSAWPTNLKSDSTVKAGDCALYSDWFGGTGWYYSIYQ